MSGARCFTAVQSMKGVFVLISKCRSILVALLALCAFAALGATSASAFLPRFSSTLRGTAESPTSFVLAGSVVLHAELPDEVECNSGKSVGSITGEKSGTIKFVFKQCSAGEFGTACKSPGSKEERTIESETIPFVLAYTKTTSPVQVAIDYNHKGSTLMTYTCDSIETVVRHAILSPVTPLNTVATSFTSKFEISSLATQTPTENFKENNEGREESFPEYKHEPTGFWVKFGMASTSTLSELKHAGKAVEGSIEA
jgi:hypothetical protein